MTSVFMIFEITQDYEIVVPLMVANLLSFVISRRYQPTPVYHALLHQDGVHLPSPASHASRTSRTARHVMTSDFSFIPPDTSVNDAWRWASEHEAPVCLVGARDRLLGAVTHQQLEEWRSTDKANERIGTVLETSFVHAHPDQPIDVVLERLAESGGLLPIVSRADARRVEGVVTPETILPIRERRLPRNMESPERHIPRASGPDAADLTA
jgi:CIC family chloride channel protein